MTLIQKIPPNMRFMKMNFCVQRHVEKGEGLYIIRSRHNLYHTDHIQNDKQRIAV